jgi:hypothetical protein
VKSYQIVNTCGPPITTHFLSLTAGELSKDSQASKTSCPDVRQNRSSESLGRPTCSFTMVSSRYNRSRCGQIRSYNLNEMDGGKSGDVGSPRMWPNPRKFSILRLTVNHAPAISAENGILDGISFPLYSEYFELSLFQMYSSQTNLQMSLWSSLEFHFEKAKLLPTA